MSRSKNFISPPFEGTAPRFSPQSFGTTQNTYSQLNFIDKKENVSKRIDFPLEKYPPKKHRLHAPRPANFHSSHGIRSVTSLPKLNQLINVYLQSSERRSAHQRSFVSVRNEGPSTHIHFKWGLVRVSSTRVIATRSCNAILPMLTWFRIAHTWRKRLVLKTTVVNSENNMLTIREGRKEGERNACESGEFLVEREDWRHFLSMVTSARRRPAYSRT